MLTDPALVARLTPFLHTVRAEGEHWVWQMTKVPVLGKSFSFTFRERMDFDPSRTASTSPTTRAPGADEARRRRRLVRARDAPEGTRLETSMEITVDLPFPGVVRPAVETAMKGVVARDGPALLAQPAAPPRRHDRLKRSTADNLARFGNVRRVPHIVACRKQPYEEGARMPFSSVPSTPTAVLGDDLIRVVKLLHHVRQQAPRRHPQVDPMAYPLLFNLMAAPDARLRPRRGDPLRRLHREPPGQHPRRPRLRRRGARTPTTAAPRRSPSPTRAAPCSTPSATTATAGSRACSPTGTTTTSPRSPRTCATSPPTSRPPSPRSPEGPTDDRLHPTRTPGRTPPSAPAPAAPTTARSPTARSSRSSSA